MTPATETKLDRYEIRSKISEGAMGEVYLSQVLIALRRLKRRIRHGVNK
jgi:hypothetical protein